jgi:FkbM family methyltransferase
MPESARHALRGLYNGVLARTAGDFVCTLPGGERLRVLPQHRNITWNPEEYAAFRAAVRPGDCVLDVGANLGAYSLLFGLWAGDTGRVFAFEPAPVPHAGLTAHVVLNGLTGRVTPLQQAVTSADGTADFIADGMDGANRLTTTGAAGGSALARVTTTTLDSFCRAAGLRPDVIKIDAEGAELDVLRGGRATIRAAGAGLRLFVEMHPHLWPAFGTSRAEIEAELAHQGLTPERLDGLADIWSIEGVCLRLRPCGS